MGQPSALASALFGVALVGVVLLAWGGWRMAFRQGNRPKGALMLVAALVLLGNVLIWTV